MRAECYDMVVYCDNGCTNSLGDLVEARFFTKNKTAAHRAARACGWSLGKKDLCPKCNPRHPRTRAFKALAEKSTQKSAQETIQESAQEARRKAEWWTF